MPRDAVVQVLQAVEAGRGTARDLLDAALLVRPLEDRDRDLAREIVYGTLRRLGTIDHLLSGHSSTRLPKLDPAVRAAIRAAAYQVLFLDRVPAAAAVDAAVSQARRAAGGRAAGYANAVLRALARTVEGRAEGDGDDAPRRTVPTGDGRHVRLRGNALPDPGRDRPGSLSLRWSMPRWLVKRWEGRHSPLALETILRHGIARPRIWLRALPGRERDLARLLPAAAADGRLSPHFLLEAGGPVEEIPGYAEGLFVVQDPTSGEAIERLEPAEGCTVLEIGAGRGGKTAILAALVGPRGRVVAVDPHAGRLGQLRETLARAGLAGRVQVVEADATVPGALPPGPYDRVLVDAPCSNTGVLARRVEARWRIKRGDIQVLAALGRRLLEAGLDRLRPGGTCVYSVCSLEPEEGPETVRRALGRRPGPDVPEFEETVLPVAGRRDGGYAARIEAPV